MSAAVADVVAAAPRLNVPNHLLDTQLFPSHATLNNVLATDKQSLHFKGYHLGKIHKQKVCLTNKANGARRFHVLSPSGGFFKIRFKKAGKLTPGMNIKIIVEFSTNEYNYYEDFIKIHCEGGHNLVIPLHAYPVLDMTTFPKLIPFSNTPICKSVFKKVKLTSPLPVDFLFKLHYSGHPSLSVSPSSGIIPGEGTVELKVSFCPTEYITASGVFELCIQQHDNPVYRCTLTALSQPGAEKDIVMASESTVMPSLSGVRKTRKMKDPVTLDPSTLVPIKQSRKSRKKSSPPTRQGTVVDGVRFPENLDNPTAVAFVLNQKPGHLRASELKTGSAAATIAKQIGNERQLKCAVFESIVKQKALEERNNRLRWTTELGADAMSPEAITDVLEERETARAEYRLTQANYSEDVEFEGRETRCKQARVYRQANQHTTLTPSFDPYKSSEWDKRKLALTRFIRAVRKVIVTYRVARRFRLMTHRSAPAGGRQTEPQGSITVPEIGHVTPVYLPLYHTPHYDQDLTPNKLGEVTPAAVSLHLHRSTPVFSLHVPRASELLQYSEHEISVVSSREPDLPDLVTGAEDELISALDDQQTLIKERLSFPLEMTLPTKYPPLMIFQPAPGIQAVGVQGGATLETSEEYYLSPLLRRPIKHRGPIQPLCKQGVIQGTQRWNKFPCQLLVSANNVNTVGSVWCPRRESLLDPATPPLMNGLTPDLEVEQDEDDNVTYPTPESVAADFQLEFQSELELLPHHYSSHDSTGPLHRRDRESQLAAHALSQQNKLGDTIHRKLSSLQDTIRNKNLHLDLDTR